MLKRIHIFRGVLPLVFGMSSFFFVRCESQKGKTEPFVQLSGEQLLQKQIEFGRALFFDPRLSSDNTISCASCHLPEKAFTDGRSLSTGVNGRLGFRNSPSLLNLNDATHFMFDGVITSLEQQAIVPIQDTNEMNSRMGDLIQELKDIDQYAALSNQLYDRELDAWVLTRALATFQKSLISNNSLFDQFYASGDSSLLSPSALNGWKWFNEFGCIECHALPHFTDYKAHNIGGYGDRKEDHGRYRATGISADYGAFKTPTLRNIVLTAPYFHDGQMQTLSEVLQYHTYDFESDREPNTDAQLRFVKSYPEQILELESFLETLTDTSYLIRFRSNNL